MITENELEKALDLRKEIRELKLKITKLEGVKISRSEIGGVFTIDGNRVDTDEYTIQAQKRFRDEILKIYEKMLEDLEEEYKGIVVSEEDAIEDAIFGKRDEDNY